MTKRKSASQPEPNENDYTEDELEATQLTEDPSPLSAEKAIPEIPADAYEGMTEETHPTGDDIARQYSEHYLTELISQLPDLADMPSWDRSLFSSQQSELYEQLLEGLQQQLQIVRTTTFTEYDDMLSFLADVIQLCDAIPPAIVAFVLVKYHIRKARPE